MSRIPKWNPEIIENEKKRIEDTKLRIFRRINYLRSCDTAQGVYVWCRTTSKEGRY